MALIGQMARPDAVCVDLAGERVIPLQRKTGRQATVLIFYLAHCPIARKMTPEINRVYREFEPKGVNFVMVHEDLMLAPSEVSKEAKSFGLLPTIVIDRWRSQMRVSGATISPEAVVYDSNMRLRYRGRISNLFYGLGKMRPKTTSRDLQMALKSILSKQDSDVVTTQAVGCILPKL